MAEFLIYAGTHWMDDLDQQTIDNFDDAEMDKYESRYQSGDIVQVYEDGTCSEQPAPNSKFFILKLPGVSISAAKNYLIPWKRRVTVARTLNNEEDGVFEYSATVIGESVSGDEYFKARELIKKPMDVSVLEKNSTHLSLRLQPSILEDYLNQNEEPSNWVTVDPIERRDLFEAKALSMIGKLRKILRNRRYRVALENLPQGVKDTLEQDRWYTSTWSAVQTYLVDKLTV